MVSRSPAGSAGTAEQRSAVRTVAMLVAATFVLVGILGFIPGVTTDYDTLQFASHDSQAKLFGVVGFALARRAETARAFLIGGGAIYLVLWLYGLVIDHGSGANFVPVNTADNWLHFVLGVGMIALGLVFGPRKRRS